MRNVTITLDEEVIKWARIRAAEKETSLSRLVGELLKEKMLEENAYGAAMRRYLDRSPKDLKKPGTDYPSRESLHER